jgi:hypothetical protein
MGDQVDCRGAIVIRRGPADNRSSQPNAPEKWCKGQLNGPRLDSIFEISGRIFTDGTG